MAGRIDYPTVSFATDNGTYFLHFGSYIHFTYGGSVIFLPILAGYIAQGTGRTQIGYRIARSMFQYVVGNSNQRIFFTVHLAVFANHCQAVYIRVYNKCNVCLPPFHQVHDVTQVLFQRLGIMLEVTGRFAIELLYVLNTKLLEQLRQYDTAHRVYTVDGNTKVCLSDSFHIYEVKCQYTVDVFLVVA